ncbi:hypothetical protein FRC01_000472 [Tulasnella sp. 417]|nr:hypothetical protein FRC01_000472 [Tulasnella sp. 417]
MAWKDADPFEESSPPAYSSDHTTSATHVVYLSTGTQTELDSELPCPHCTGSVTVPLENPHQPCVGSWQSQPGGSAAAEETDAPLLLSVSTTTESAAGTSYDSNNPPFTDIEELPGPGDVASVIDLNPDPIAALPAASSEPPPPPSPLSPSDVAPHSPLSGNSGTCHGLSKTPTEKSSSPSSSVYGSWTSSEAALAHQITAAFELAALGPEAAQVTGPQASPSLTTEGEDVFEAQDEAGIENEDTGEIIEGQDGNYISMDSGTDSDVSMRGPDSDSD